MTTVWNKDYNQKAAKQQKYIFVSPNQKQNKFKVLTGAYKAWNSGKDEVNYIYLPQQDLRLMGLRDNVVAKLKEYGLSENDIKNALKGAYTRENHGNAYLEEKERVKAYKTGEKESNKNKIKYHLEDLDWFVEDLKNIKEQPIVSANVKNVKVSPKSKRDIFRTLWEKIQGTTKILDVSLLDTSGAKIRDAPSKSGKVKSDVLAIETDNIKNYKKAIEWIFGSAEEYKDEIEIIKTKLADKKKPIVKDTTTKKEEPAKKKVLGSPRRALSKSPGALQSKGGENFTQIPPIPKK